VCRSIAWPNTLANKRGLVSPTHSKEQRSIRPIHPIDPPTQEPALNDVVSEAAPRAGRVGRVLITIASGWLRTIATLVIGLVCTPILLRLLGRDRVGVMRIAEQWFAYLEFLNFGLAGAVSVLLIKASSTGGPSDVWATIRLGMRLFARQLIWIFPISVVLIAIFPFAFELAPELRAEFYWATPANLLIVLMTPMIVFRMNLDVRQRGYLINLAIVVNAAIVAGLGIVFAWSGFGLTGQICAACAGAVAVTLLYAWSCGAFRKQFWQAPLADAPTGAQIWRLRWPMLIAGVGYQISQLSDNIMAGIIFGVGEVAAFYLTQRLLLMANMFGGALGGASTWAGLIELRAKAGPEAFQTRLIEVTKLSVGVNLVVLAPVLGYNRHFVSLWVGPEFYAGDLLTLASFVQLAVFNFIYIYGSMLDGMGETRKRVWVNMAGTAIKVALIVPLTWEFGVAGLPLATVIGLLATDAWFSPWIFCRDHGSSGRRIGGALIRAVAVGAAWAVVCHLVGARSIFLWPGWMGLLVEVGALEIIGFAIIWSVLLSRSDQALWKQRFRGWFGIRAEPAVSAST
jgi:O-antigen/teichoic acid export membrane protein